MADRDFGLLLPAIVLESDIAECQGSRSHKDLRRNGLHSAENIRSAGYGIRGSETSASRNPDDGHLLIRIGGGDREALSLLFRRHARMVQSVALRILRDPGEADDLVQEVFLFVFRKAALFDPARGSARSWLVQVTYHRAFDRRRYLASRRAYSNLELNEAILRSEEPAVLNSFYDDTIEAALGCDVLRRIEESLSAMQSRVIHLYFVEGQTIEEIAATIGQSTANVRNHYYRALEKMRREIFAFKLQAK